MSEHESLNTPIGELFQACPFGIMLVDRNGHICEANPSLANLLNCSIDELVGLTSDNLPKNLQGILQENSGIVHIEFSGSERWLQCWTSSLAGRASTVAEVRYFTDVTEAMRLREEHTRLLHSVEDLVTTDPVTALPNHKALLQSLNIEVSRSRRYSNPLSIILLSVESEPTPYGSPALSDSAIIAVSRMLKDQLRWADLIARDGDNQFMLVLPETPMGPASALIHKIESHLEQMRVEDEDGESISLVGHFGVASWQKGDDTQNLIDRAEANMEVPFSTAKAG